MAQRGPTRGWWIENTGVAPASGVPFPADAFPRYARAGARSQWDQAVKEGGSEAPEWEEYFTTHKEYVAARREARAWSKQHSQQGMSKWSDSFGPERTKAYYSAYVDDPWRHFGVTGRRRGSPWHKYYVVEVGGYMSDDEYDASYPIAA